MGDVLRRRVGVRFGGTVILEDIRWLIKKYGPIFVLLIIVVIMGCFILNKTSKKKIEEAWEPPIEIAEQSEDGLSETVNETEETDVWEKGYNLPVEDGMKERAMEDCKNVMAQIKEIYIAADKGNALNAVLSDETLDQMKNIIKNTGNPVVASEQHSNMENYQKMEQFLLDSEDGKEGNVLLYHVNYDGGISREEFICDGEKMYVLWTKATWGDSGKIVISYVSYTRIKEWTYTEKGYFCYELCVPEPPDVTEIVDGSTAIRVKPLGEQLIELSKKCVSALGYQGNNILCSNWDQDTMEKLDYNGMYEYLYSMKYQKKFDSEEYPDGIPKQEFENLIMEYFPITVEQIREWAVFDEEKQTYAWARLGCMNYTPTYFGTSMPEVTGIRENDDGTMTLTVEAVCDMVICNDAVITHELTVQFKDDGTFQYLRNKILDDGIQNIPDYQYRIQVK